MNKKYDVNKISKMKRYFFFIVFIFIPFTLFSQKMIDNKRDRVGGYIYYTLNFHSADFKQLPNVENCCPNFESGNGSAISVGGLYELPLSAKFSLSLRAGYSGMNALLIATENKPIFDLNTNRLIQQAPVEHSINTTIHSFGLETLMSFNPIGGLRFYGGLRSGLINEIVYEQKEEIKQAGFVFVENKLKTRNEVSGNVEDINKFQLALMLGASMEFPLNKEKTFLLSPEVFFTIGLTGLAKDMSWTANSFRTGLAFKYAFPFQSSESLPLLLKKEEPTIAETKQSEKQKEINSEFTKPDMIIGGLSKEMENIPSDTIRYEEFLSTELKPLLNYVFFDENSSVLPSRYTRLNKNEKDNFSILEAAKTDILNIYYSILNIVAKRLYEYPDATITLTGCVSDNNDEKNNTNLSQKRAETVKRYFTDVWNIDPKRIATESRTLPQHPSRTNDKDKYASDEENRRVEIISDNPEIVAPIIVNDTMQTFSPSLVYCTVSDKEKQAFTVSICNESLYKESSCISYGYDKGTKTDTILWKVHEHKKLIGEANNIYIISRANDENEKQYINKKIVIRKKTVADKSKIGDKRIAIYRLILFDFDKSELSDRNARISEFVKKRIESESDVRIEGFTDYLGDEIYNKKLSGERAATVGKYIGLKQELTQGKGEQSYFTNTLPEGRFYNRTVVITVETPTR